MSFIYIIVFIMMLVFGSGTANAHKGAPNPAHGAEIQRKLPLHVMNVTPTEHTMAIFYTGDGGWQSLDEEVGLSLVRHGIPVIGVNSLRYFWREKSARQTASDLSWIIDAYTRRLNVQNVILIGFSFGADIMPASFNGLKKTQKNKVKQISLLALSHKVDYEVSLSGWLGLDTEGKGGNPLQDLKTIDPELVQCIYGIKDRDNACPALRDSGAEVIGMAGGHHFGNDYRLLAQHIIRGFENRLGNRLDR